MYSHAATQLPGGFAALRFEPASEQYSDVALVWLHGRGERGADLSLVTKFGLPEAISKQRAQVAATVLCPQLEHEREWEPCRVAELMAHVRQQFQRTAIIGYSLGALGICELLAGVGSQADLHVAIAPRMRTLPTMLQPKTHLLSICGEHDRWPSADAFYHRLRALQGRVDEVVLPNEGHFISGVALSHPSLVSALSALGAEIRHTA